MNKTFCIKAFEGLSVTPSGACAPCCLFEKMIHKSDGRPYTISEDAIEDIYASDFMADVRKKMIAGEAVEACRQCYQVEDQGGYSLRNITNDAFYEEYPNYEVPAHGTNLPTDLDLKINNRCNLKCRMCQPRDSNLIYNEFKTIGAGDPSFHFYTNTTLTDPDLAIPLADVADWSRSPGFQRTFEKIMPGLRKLSLVGGEPFLLDETYEILGACRDSGQSKHMLLVITSNFMHVPIEKLTDLLPHFKKVHLNISLDALGKELHYIRYPSQFEKIFDNLKRLQQLRRRNIHFHIVPTVQVYNVLYIDQVYRFVDQLLRDGYALARLPLILSFVEFPVHLNIRILPENVRAAAIAKLRPLLLDCPTLMANVVVRKSLVQLIATLETEYITHHDYLPEFLHYSEVLDRARHQRGRDYLPELFDLLQNHAPKAPVESYHFTRERGWSLARQNRLEEAIKEFERAILTSHNKELDLREMAWMKMSLGHHADSLRLYEEAFRLDPNDRYVLKGLALHYSMNGNTVDLGRVLDRALETNPDDPDLLKLVT